MALGRVLLYITITAKDLHHFIGDHVVQLRSPHLYDGALARVVLDSLLNLRGIVLGDTRQSLVDHANGAITQRLAGEDTGCTISELLLDQPEFADRFTECLARLRVLDSLI